MPTYDYKCDQCGLDFELRLKFSDSIEQPCPIESCNSNARRLFSAVPIVFKGNYVNDYGQERSSSGKQIRFHKNTSQFTGSPESTAPQTKSSDATSSDTKSSETFRD